MEPSSSLSPSTQPSISFAPTDVPSRKSSLTPASNPSNRPSISFTPTGSPSSKPIVTPTLSPSVEATSLPSYLPSFSARPTSSPSISAKPSSSVSPSVVPSRRPTMEPTSSVSPSTQPSISFAPTDTPSGKLSLTPTSNPSISPSLLPTMMVPSTQPSATRSFQIRSTFKSFDTSENWCLTFDSDTDTGAVNLSKINVRVCNPSNNFQIWSRDKYGQLSVTGLRGEKSCMLSLSKYLYMDECSVEDDPGERRRFELKGVEGGIEILQRKNGNIFLTGFDPDKKYSKVRLYEFGSLITSLNTWKVHYIPKSEQ